jgi:ubiquinone/menaquinone biosynthesis C-methylase UbiE
MATQVQAQPIKPGKAYKGMAMEGMVARWYTKIRAKDDEVAVVVHEVDDLLPAGSRILEVAPGLGYLAIELAKLGKYHIVGLDISHTFVEIAQTKAREARVEIDFRQGNASDMPFDAATFDFILCRAAFKNFTEPVQAIQEMYRVLRPGGQAVIMDLRGDASMTDIKTHVDSMGLNPINKFMTTWTFKNMLLKNAYTAADIQAMVAQTSFGVCDIRQNSIGMDIWLAKRV